VLIEQGATPEEAQEYVVWYDTSRMIQRPNRLADATALHEKGVISDDALRAAGGFDESDKPETLDRPIEIAIEMAMANPALVDNMAEIIKAFKDVLSPAVVNDLPTSEQALDQVDEATAETDVPTDEKPKPGLRSVGSEQSMPEAMPEAMR
jgi:hypothetical protein